MTESAQHDKEDVETTKMAAVGLYIVAVTGSKRLAATGDGTLWTGILPLAVFLRRSAFEAWKVDGLKGHVSALVGVESPIEQTEWFRLDFSTSRHVNLQAIGTGQDSMEHRGCQRSCRMCSWRPA